MYDDLISSLRICRRMNSANDNCIAYHDGSCEAEPVCMYELMDKAADAIEELSKQLDAKPVDGDKFVDAIIKSYEQSRWIPVTERLPEAYEDVLLLFPNNQAAGFRDRDGCWGVYSGNGFYTEVAENETKPTHWAKKLPQPPEGGR